MYQIGPYFFLVYTLHISTYRVIYLFFCMHHFADSPTCAQGQQKIYEAAKPQEIQISCYINANQNDNIEFSWTFNNSANLMDILVYWLFLLHF